MLDNIANTTDSYFKRQVTPSVEGNLRPESAKEAETTKNERLQARQADSEKQREISRERADKQRENSETGRLRSERGSQDSIQTDSRAAAIAEKLVKTVRESRREDARQSQQTSVRHPEKSRQVNRAYMANLPIEQNRILDEIA
jgi:hypothetical protein